MHFFGISVLSLVALLARPILALQPQIPSVASFTASKGNAFTLLPTVKVLVDSKSAHAGSPSILDFAQTFRQDLASVLGDPLLPSVQTSSHPTGTTLGPAIYLTIDPSLKFTLFNGKSTDEGYHLDVTSTVITISAFAPIGVWWGTRTLLQQAALALSGGSKLATIPVGKVVDSPGWEIRGFMLDAGRHWFEADFIADLCIYASFFKINELHLHASDNLWNPAFLYGDGNMGWKNLYAAFRFQPPAGSPIEGLVPRKNESWAKSDFQAMQSTCTSHGITLIPEIDTPGHSLVINQWKPELMQSGQPDHLNLSYPETIPTIKSIWDEFLPWFTASEVSIGADEYDSALANDYISFVNEMSDYIQAKSKKSIRIWGTNEPSKTLSVSTDITIQHWDFPGDDIPNHLMASGYDIINFEQTFLYLDEKTSEGGQFPLELNQTLMWSGAPGGKGWAPNIFTTNDPSNNTEIDNPHLRGSIMALWCDWGNNATTRLEIYYQLARSLAVFGEKTWSGSEVRSTALTQSQFDTVYPILNAAAPGQNLNRVVKPLVGNIVYEFPIVLFPLPTLIDSVGPPYTLTFTVKPSSKSPSTGTLFTGIDSKLHVSSLTFEATGQLYALNYTLPQNKFTTVAIHATRDYTYAIINGDQSKKLYWTTTMDIWGDYMQVSNISFAAPSQIIGGDGFSGEIINVKLELGA